MAAGAGYQIAHQPEFGLQAENPAMVHHRSVPIVMAGEEIEGFSGEPYVHGGLGHAGPAEWTGRNGLVAAIHLEGIVGRGAAEAIPLGTGVTERARINQDGSAIGDELDAERVGMAVPPGEDALWSGVDEKLGLGRRHYINAGGGEG